jgi:hypothetical protein
MERRVTFFSPTLGITLHRGSDGFVRVVEVVPTTPNGTIQRQGDIAVGDILCEVEGIANLRNMPLAPQGWGRVVRHLKTATATRPLVLYVVAGENEKNLHVCDDEVSDLFSVDVEGIDIDYGHVSGDQSFSNNIKYIPHCRPMHSGLGDNTTNSIVSPVDDSREGQRQGHSLISPKGLVVGARHAVGKNSSNRNDKGSSSSSGGNGATFTSRSVAQYYLQMGTACLIPAELRPTNCRPSRTVDHDCRQPHRHGNVRSDNYTVQETQIDCNDMQQMLMVSQISMDEDLMELQRLEDELMERYPDEYEYDDDLSGIRPIGNHCGEEHKHDDPRKRGPQPIKPPRYNPHAVPKRWRTRRLSF